MPIIVDTTGYSPCSLIVKGGVIYPHSHSGFEWVNFIRILRIICHQPDSIRRTIVELCEEIILFDLALYQEITPIPLFDLA